MRLWDRRRTEWVPLHVPVWVYGRTKDTLHSTEKRRRGQVCLAGREAGLLESSVLIAPLRACACARLLAIWSDSASPQTARPRFTRKGALHAWFPWSGLH